MDDAHRDLIRDVADLTGSNPPDWADAAAPTLQEAGDKPIYLVGVIGGKDVGKSSLVNALLGSAVAGVSSTGEGTHRALAYAHRDDAAAVKTLLNAAAAGQFDVVTHAIDTGRGRVLLDLPDIDSVWSGHADLTRGLLRHMLFPVWVQSVEKYADAQPMRMLSKVAAGNSPANFLFVLTKADQLAARHGEAAVGELKADYAARVAKTCALEESPRVFAVDNRAAEAFDLQTLRQTVLAVRSAGDLAAARQSAQQQQSRTLHAWLSQQRVDDRLAAARRLLAEAESLVAARLAEPLVDRVTERLAGEARGDLIEPAVRSRLSYWPVVNILDGVLGPVVAAVRSRGRTLVEPAAGAPDVGRQLRGVFADLVQRDPQLLALYAQTKLWESDPADAAAAVLQRRMEAAVDTHRAELLKTVGRPNWLVRLAAPIVTLGAAVWFPVVQPILELVLQGTVTDFSRASLLLVVKLLGATYLIQSVGILAIYFVALWMTLRWLGYRRVERALRQTTDASHPAAAVLTWSTGLLDPIRRQVEKLSELSQKIESLIVVDRAAA